MAAQTHDSGSTAYAARSDRTDRTDHGDDTYTETKLGFKTSEFLIMVAAAVAILVATYVDGDDTLTQNDGWRYASWVAVAYIVSRGLAKLGVREPYNSR